MKGLVKKILMPLAISAAILMPNSVFAQEEKKKDFKPKTQISFALGGFRGAGQSMRRIYGTMPKVRCSLGHTFSEHFRLEGAFSYMKGTGEPDILYCEGGTITDKWAGIKFKEFDAIAYYLIPGKDSTFYLGAGFTSINYEESIRIEFIPGNERIIAPFSPTENIIERVNGTENGLIGILGVEAPIKGDKNFLFYLQLSGTSAMAKGYSGKVNIGGYSLEGGVKLEF